MKNQAGEKKDANILHVISLEVSGLPLFPTGELFLFGRFLVRIANDEKTMVCSPKKITPRCKAAWGSRLESAASRWGHLGRRALCPPLGRPAFCSLPYRFLWLPMVVLYPKQCLHLSEEVHQPHDPPPKLTTPKIKMR